MPKGFKHSHTQQHTSSAPEVDLVRVVVRVGIGMLAFLVGAWVSLGRTATEKIATTLAMPCGLVWFLLICLAVAAMSTRRRPLIVATFGILTVFTLAGNGMVSAYLAHSLEREYVQIDPFQEQPFDAVIVLGGGASLGANQRSQGNGSGDRLILAAQLYHRNVARKLICTGKRIVELNNAGPDPAEQSASILQSLAVSEQAIEQLGGRNTAEEMATLGQRFAGTDQRVGLLTSAWHLPRAMRLAHRNGLEPIPLPADFASRPGGNAPTTAAIVLSLIPQADNMSLTTRMCKEYLAALAGR
jgi:uncharacterized SAM-binding protein YcdF (DUF218 family)